MGERMDGSWVDLINEMRTISQRDAWTDDFRGTPSLQADRLVGLVVKASASRAEGPGFESGLRRDFFGVSHRLPVT